MDARHGTGVTASRYDTRRGRIRRVRSTVDRLGLVRLPLQVKATLGIALLVAAALSVSGWLAYYTARRALRLEMEERITAVAEVAAAQFGRFDTESLAVLEPGAEDTRTHRGFRARIGDIRAATGARRVYIFTPDGKSLVDSLDDVPIGATYRFLSANRVHVDEALAGSPPRP